MGVGVGVGVGIAANVGVGKGVGVGVAADVGVGRGVGVAVAVGVGLEVWDCTAIGSGPAHDTSAKAPNMKRIERNKFMHLIILGSQS